MRAMFSPEYVKMASERTEKIKEDISFARFMGMTEDQINRILGRKWTGGDESVDDSFGLWGTIERVRLYCNSEDVVRISSEVGEYTEVEFMIKEQGRE